MPLDGIRNLLVLISTVQQLTVSFSLVHHSPSSSVKVKNEWSSTSSQPCVFKAWCLKYSMSLWF